MSEGGIDAIRTYGWVDLWALWTRLLDGNAPGFSGKAFEYLILRAFELSGARVRMPYHVRLFDEVVEQIDGAVHIESLSFLIECKDTADPVNVEPIAKLRNQLLRRHGSAIGMVFSRSGYTYPASILAQFLAPQTILLWEGGEIEAALRREDFVRALLAKHRWCVETGIPDFDTRLEDVV